MDAISCRGHSYVAISCASALVVPSAVEVTAMVTIMCGGLHDGHQLRRCSMKAIS